MKESVLLFITMLTTLAQSCSHTNATVINGKVTDSNQGVITLMQFTYYRGNLNYDGFKSIAAPIDENGDFTLKTDKITDGADYSLIFNKTAISDIVLFKGDNISVEFDMERPTKNFFAKGTGAGKINMLHLWQFEKEYYDESLTIEEYGTLLNSISAERLAILNAVYAKNADDPAIANARNRDRIVRIINETPLSQREFELLETRIKFIKYEIAEFIATKSLDMENAGPISFSSSFFSAFNKDEYTRIQNLNHAYITMSLNSILKVEYLKNLNKTNPNLDYKDWNLYFGTPEYVSWERNYLKQNFPAEVHDKYYADYAAFAMTLGMHDETPLTYIQESSTNQYFLKRLNGFKSLLDNGLSNEEYNLGANILDKPKFDALLEKYKGKDVLIAFWSAQYAGSSIIDQIPALDYLQKNNNLEVLYISIDKDEYKNLWAARIIDNNWKGAHYFMPVENNENTLKEFSSDKIYVMCNGGATFTFIDKDGTIHNDIGSPYQLTAGKIKEYVK